MCQHRFDGTLGSQVPQSLQPGPYQQTAAVALILKDPFRWNSQLVSLRILPQGGCLTADGVLFPLLIGGDSCINGCCLAHKFGSSVPELRRLMPAPIAGKLEPAWLKHGDPDGVAKSIAGTFWSCSRPSLRALFHPVLQQLGHDLTDYSVLLATTTPHRLNQWTGQIDRKDRLW